MATRRQLAVALERVASFDDPSIAREQYLTPPEVAATIVHEADLRGDLEGPVIDLGTGTGILAIGAALRGAEPVIGIDVDPIAVRIALRNAADLEVSADWLVGDVGRLPLRGVDGATVVMNPPFGAQRGHRGADRTFLEAAAWLGTCSYSIHNAGSRSFVEAFVAAHGGYLTHAFALELDLPAQFHYHEEEVSTIEAEAYRIEWTP